MLVTAFGCARCNWKSFVHMQEKFPWTENTWTWCHFSECVCFLFRNGNIINVLILNIFLVQLFSKNPFAFRKAVAAEKCVKSHVMVFNLWSGRDGGSRMLFPPRSRFPISSRARRYYLIYKTHVFCPVKVSSVPCQQECDDLTQWIRIGKTHTHSERQTLFFPSFVPASSARHVGSTFLPQRRHLVYIWATRHKRGRGKIIWKKN